MTDYDRYRWMNSEIGRLEAESSNAERRLSDALSTYDHQAAAQAQRDITKLESQLVQLNANKDMHERQLQQRQHQQHQQQQQYRQPATVEDAIRSLPNLT